MNRTLFISPLQQAWTQNVDDPAMANFSNQLVGDARLNVLYQRIEQAELDDGDTRTITFANVATSDWKYLVIKCVGSAHVNLSGFDTDGTTPITAKFSYYGTELLPGIGMLSSYNLSTIQLEGDANGTVLEVYAAVSCKDDDARLVTND
jgi:hypothetical protein